MARIQILELPSVVVGEVVETPFALIIDEAGDLQTHSAALDHFKDAVGAKAIGTFTGTIDIPAND